METLKNDFLSLFVVDGLPVVKLAPGFAPGSSASSRDLPVVIEVVGDETGVVGLPLTKSNVEFSNVGGGVAFSLLSVFSSPFGVALIPWSIVLVGTPWVSHLDEFLSMMGSSFKFKSSDNTVSVTRDHVVVRDLACSSHVVIVFEVACDSIPKFFVGG